MIDADPQVDHHGLLACQSLQAKIPFARIRYFAEIESTNTAAMQDLDASEILAAPQLYVSDCQTAGRGRHGRSWLADNGTLTFSLVIANVRDSFLRAAPVSIACGVAVARTIDHLASPLQSRIKWPNDVYLDGGKVSGVLIECSPRLDAIVIGVGLNVATNLSQSTVQLDTPRRSITQLTQRYPHRYQWLDETVTQLLSAIDELSVDPRSIIDDYRSRCLLRGHSVRYLQGQQWHHATCEGIDENGALRVRDEQGGKVLTSGDVQRLRIS